MGAGHIMRGNLFQGKLVRLVAMDEQAIASAMSRWMRDSEYWRLMASKPSIQFSIKSNKDWFEKQLGENPSIVFWFIIQNLQDERLIGEVALDGIQWHNGEAFVGISIGERAYWNQGYGTDAMRVILRYAFVELNLSRVSLDVFAYNGRAIRSYEKAGFKREGQLREFLLRDGQRWDLINMGILRSEWLERLQ
jgi:RimJ/RimL family protein N-acetyltransferase